MNAISTIKGIEYVIFTRIFPFKKTIKLPDCRYHWKYPCFYASAHVNLAGLLWEYGLCEILTGNYPSLFKVPLDFPDNTKKAIMQKKIEIVTVDNIPIQVDCFGGVAPSDIKNNPGRKPKDLILMIPGNPGVPAFYDDFLQRLHEKTNKPVWIVSHGGHSCRIKQNPPLRGNESLYNLNGQIEQKRHFIEQYLKNVKLHVIGHSIGSKMILEALQSVNSQVTIEKCYFLFPTVERMAETRNGKIVTFAYRYLLWLILLGAFILENLPNFLQVILLKIYFWIAAVPDHNVPAVLDLIHPNVLEQCFFLANDEIKMVRELNHEAVNNLSKKLKLYYGATDGWVPLSYYEDFKKKHENVDAEVCSKGIDHAFVLRQSFLMADIVSSWITMSNFL